MTNALTGDTWVIVQWAGGEAPFQVQSRAEIGGEWLNVDGLSYASRQTNIAITAMSHYRVASMAGVSASSDRRAPTIPSGVTAVAPAPGRVDLFWNASSDEGPQATGVEFYNIYRNGIFVIQTPAATTNVSDVAVANWSSSTYAVSAVDFAFNQSERSPPVGVMTVGPTNCPLFLSPLDQSFASAGGDAEINVSSSGGCSWVARSGEAWIRILSGEAGSGNGVVRYGVDANTNTTARSGTIIVGIHTFSVTQDGDPLDSVAPTVALISPTNGTAVSGTVLVSATASDNVGVTRVEFYRDGLLLFSDTTSPYSASFDTTTVGNGSHDFLAKAFDAAGNSAASTFSTVTVSNGAGNGTWARRMGGTGSDQGRVVAVNGSGQSVVAGTFQGSVDLGGGALTNAGGSDLFIAKYTSAGDPVWSRRWGGSGAEVVRGIVLDGSGNVYVAGQFSGTTDLGGGAVTSAGLNDMFVAKYSAAGGYLWARVMGGSDDDVISGLAGGGDGAVVVTGYFRRAVDFGGGIVYGTFNGQDSFLAKYSAGGQHVWSRSFWGDSGEEGTGVAVDRYENIVLTGKFQGKTDLGGGVMSVQGSSDFYVAQFTADGAHRWSRRYGGSFADASTGVAVDGEGEIVVLGYFSQTIDLGGGVLRTASTDYDVFLAKYGSTDGAHRWSRSFAGPGYEMPYGVSADGAGNVAITGSFQYSIDMGTGVLTSVSAGTTDFFVAEYDSRGVPLWSERFGGPSSDYGMATGMGSAGQVVVTGMFSGVAEFGGQTLTSAGSSDAFLLQLSR